MVARLGNVLYWAGCVAAVLIIGFGVLTALYDPIIAVWPGLTMITILTVTSSILAWLIGRAFRYVLAGT